MTARQLVVVGGGVAGLAAARTAQREAERTGLGLRVTLLEASDRLGGKVFTETVDGVPWEWGPDALVATKPRGRDLLEELGLLDEAVSPATGRAYVLHRGELRPLPPGLAMGVPTGVRPLRDAVRAGILSRRGAARALAEPLIPRLRQGDRHVDDAVRRRLGREVADRLVLPLVGGVFGEVSSLDMAMPDLSRARSLVLAARGRSPVRFLGLRGGMGRLVEALAAELDEAGVRTGVEVRGLVDLSGRLTLRTAGDPVETDAAVLAVPASTARSLLSSVRPRDPIPGIPYSSSAVVHLRYPEGAPGRPLDAAGWVPAVGGPGLVSACSWVTAKWPHLRETGPHIRAVVAPDHPRLGDAALGERVAEEVGRVMRATAPPEVVRVHRWPQALPVYRSGHRRWVSALRAALPARIEVAGASYDGVGIPDCVASGEAAARRIVHALATG